MHEAELAGILLGLQLIKTEKGANTSCAIGIDNQAAIRAFQSDPRSPGQHIAREAACLAKQIQKRRSKTKYTLNLRWTAGHEGIEGNELADKEAKKAADGTNSDKQLLPSYLRKPLHINPSAVKRSQVDKAKKKWSEAWRGSTRGKRTLRIDESTPSVKFVTTISNTKIS